MGESGAQEDARGTVNLFEIEQHDGMQATRARFADRLRIVVHIGRSRVALYFHPDLIVRDDAKHIDLTPKEGHEANSSWLEAEIEEG